jgi:hypothetical protein
MRKRGDSLIFSIVVVSCLFFPEFLIFFLFFVSVLLTEEAGSDCNKGGPLSFFLRP